MNAELHAVVFRLGDEEYAVPIQTVREILRVPQIRRLPQAPPFVRGVVNVRGQILPVFEIRSRLGFEPLSSTPESRVLVVETGAESYGLLVDAVVQVLKIPPGAIADDGSLTATRSEFVSGIAQLEARLILILDLDAVFQRSAA